MRPYDRMSKILFYSIYAILLSVAIILQPTFVYARSFARITVKVVNEGGVPVEGARVGMGFTIYKKGGWSSDENKVIGSTDSLGTFTGSAFADNDMGFNVTKDGYYKSVGDYKFKESSLGRWQPWNPEITVVLRKIEKPVPMYARDTKMSKLRIPASNKAIGFDLMEFDWISPYGKGKHADFYFKLTGNYVSRNEYDMQLVLSFQGEYDGIQVIEEDRSSGSAFKLPRLAYEAGYKKEKVLYWKEGPKQKTETNFVRNNNNYIFRVRSEEKNGKLFRAMYGKILGDIEFYPDSKNSAEIIFKYYLNPDYTRNLEFGENLFKDLPDLERVGIQ